LRNMPDCSGCQTLGAAENKPGVWFGLILSRRLAREQGGDLECAASESR
jgi:hypothetical protein